MALTWTLSEIRAKVRSLTGKPSTSQISDSDIDDKINDFYQNRFPMEADVDELRGWYTKTLSATDSGEYDIPVDVLVFEEPIKFSGAEGLLTQDVELFQEKYPIDTGQAYVVNVDGAGLDIGTTKTKVANDAFTYKISTYNYQKAAAETSLSGDTVSQGKYGAWRLEVDADGDIFVVEATENATGYDTPRKAIEGLDEESDEKAPLGFVTAINSSGTFIPGTTDLDASGVTSTFTDGFHSTRQEPLTILQYGNEWIVRPKPNDWYELLAPYKLKPSSLSSDSSTPLDVRWGNCIAHGVSVEILESDRRLELANQVNVGYMKLLDEINKKYTVQKNVTRVTKVSF